MHSSRTDPGMTKKIPDFKILKETILEYSTHKLIYYVEQALDKFKFKILMNSGPKNTWNTVVFLKKLNIILEATSKSSVGKFFSNDEGSVIDPRLFKLWILWTPREIWKINTRIMLCFSLQINTYFEVLNWK